MAEIIYSKNGEMKCTAKSVRYTGSFMGVPQLEVNIESPVPVTLMVGDYIVFSYDGIRYSIIDLPQVQKQSSSGSVGNAFVYENVVFKSPLGLLSSIDFLDTVLSDNNIHYSTLPVFSFFGDIKDFADRLQANLNRIYSSGWKVTVEGYDDSSNANYDILHDYKEISLSNQNCLDALGIPYETWKITYVFTLDDSGNNCIIFNHALDSASSKRYGKGNGLYSLTKRMSAEKPVITRLRAYGGTDNLPARYYNKQSGISESVYLPNLMIPRSKWKNQNDPVSAYIDSTDVDSEDTSMSRYGIREKSVYFDGSGEYDEIIPTIKGMTAKMIRDAKAEMQDESNVPSNTIYPDSERMDKIVAAESIADNGVENTGEVYTDSVILVLPKGTDGNLGFTKNGEFVLRQEFMTETTVSVPAFYKFTPSQSYVLKIPIETTFSNPFLISTAVLNIYVSTSDGSKQLCGSVSMTYETSARDGMFYLYLSDGDFFVKIPYVGTLSFEIVFEGSAYEVSNDYVYTWQSVRLSMSQGPLILQERFWVRIKQIGFDINSYPSSEEARLVVNSGGCAGRSFNIMKNSTKFDADTETWQFECFRTLDESLNQKFPNSIYAISPDDEFVLTGLNMPDLYVEIASQKLYEEATKLLLENKGGLEIFDLDIDSKVAHTDSVKIKEGMLMPLYDDDLGIGKTAADGSMEYEYRIIDSITIEIGDETLPVISVVLREDKEASVFKSLIQKVQSVSSSTSYKAVRTQVVRITEEVSRANAVPTSSSTSVQDTSDFVTLSTDQTITGKKTFANDVVFGGEVSEGVFGSMFVPSTEGPGKYSLYVSTDPVSGEAPAAPSGIDEDELWGILGGSMSSKVIDLSHIPSIPTSKITGLDTVLSSYYTKTEADGRFVGVSNEQTITGKKTFSALLTASGGLSGSNADMGGYVSAAKLYVPSYNGNKVYDLYIGNEPVAGEAPSGSGGLDEAELWSILTDGGGGDRVAKSHLPLDAVYEDDLSRFLTSVSLATISDLNEGWDALLKAAPDFYSKGEVGELLAGYVTLATVQTVTGVKTFTSLLTASGGISGSNVDLAGYLSAAKLYVPSYSGNDVYDLYISNAPIAGEAPSGSSGIDEAELWSILTDNAGGERIAKAHMPLDAVYDADLDGYLKSVSLSTISDLHSSWDAVLKAQKPAWLTAVSLATISDLHSSWDALLKAQKPTTLAGYGITNAYTQTEVNAKLAAYLPLAGGTMNNDAEIRLAYLSDRLATLSGSSLKFDRSATTGGWTAEVHVTADDTTQVLAGAYGSAVAVNYLYYGQSSYFSADGLRIYPSGNVSIGYADESHRLRVQGTGHFSDNLTVGGNVGIGTASPQYKLDVAGTLRATGRITAAGLTSSASIVANAGITTTTLEASGAVAADNFSMRAYSGGWARGLSVRNKAQDAVLKSIAGVYGQGDTVNYCYYGQSSYIAADGLRIYPSGNVSIGYAGESHRLRVQGTGHFSGAVSMGGTLSVSGTATVGNLIATGRLYVPSTSGNNVYDLYVSTSPVSGTTPDLAAEVETLKILSTATEAHLSFSATSYAYLVSQGDFAFIPDGQSTSASRADLIVSNGYVRPGSTGVTYLGMSTARWATLYCGSANLSATLYVSGDSTMEGDLTVRGEFSNPTSSSREVKDIIAPAASYSQRLADMGKVIDYRYNGRIRRDSSVHTGLIYETVRDIMPAMCSVKDGYGALNYLSPDYINTIAGAVQEHTDEIAALKKRIKNLENEVIQLKTT